MDVKIKDFEKAAIEAVSSLRKELGAKCIEMLIRVDDYEKSCRTNVTFSTSKPGDATPVGCGPACKGN